MDGLVVGVDGLVTGVDGLVVGVVGLVTGVDGLAVGAGGLTVMVNVAVVVCAGVSPSATVTLKLLVVAVVTAGAVPVIFPVAESIVSPAGSPVADHV